MDADLYVPAKGLTYAAMILFGTDKALARLLAHAELIFEYRSDPASIPYQHRQEFRRGLLLFHDDLWTLVNNRNEVHSLRDGLFRRNIPTFNEDAVREAVLNAMCHREYRRYGSTFVRQSPRTLEVVSPGGFPPDVDASNVLFRQSPRNRRLAEALARCGLVERSGQGADRMFKAALEEGKLPPDFSASTPESVSVILHGAVQDEAFVTFLERISAEKQAHFSVADLVALDAVHRGLEVPDAVRGRLAELVALGRWSAWTVPGSCFRGASTYSRARPASTPVALGSTARRERSFSSSTSSPLERTVRPSRSLPRSCPTQAGTNSRCSSGSSRMLDERTHAGRLGQRGGTSAARRKADEDAPELRRSSLVPKGSKRGGSRWCLGPHRIWNWIGTRFQTCAEAFRG